MLLTKINYVDMKNGRMMKLRIPCANCTGCVVKPALFVIYFIVPDIEAKEARTLKLATLMALLRKWIVVSNSIR